MSVARPAGIVRRLTPPTGAVVRDKVCRVVLISIFDYRVQATKVARTRPLFFLKNIQILSKIYYANRDKLTCFVMDRTLMNAVKDLTMQCRLFSTKVGSLKISSLYNFP